MGSIALLRRVLKIYDFPNKNLEAQTLLYKITHKQHPLLKWNFVKVGNWFMNLGYTGHDKNEEHCEQGHIALILSAIIIRL